VVSKSSRLVAGVGGGGALGFSVGLAACAASSFFVLGSPTTSSIALSTSFAHQEGRAFAHESHLT
jgi:hypothetical protein